MIEEYTMGGCMTVDGTRYCRDLKIVDGKVTANWWRQEGHLLKRLDIEDILKSSPQILMVGTGYAGQMQITQSLRHDLDDKHIELITETTQQAVRTFNRLQSEGQSIAGAFHLTC